MKGFWWRIIGPENGFEEREQRVKEQGVPLARVFGDGLVRVERRLGTICFNVADGE